MNSANYRPLQGWREHLKTLLRPACADCVLDGLYAIVADPTFVLAEPPAYPVQRFEACRAYSQVVRALLRLARVQPRTEAEITRICAGRYLLLREQIAGRKPANRRTQLQIVCEFIGKIWPDAANHPGNFQERRQFARLFLHACGIAIEHPEMLNQLLEQSPLGWKDAVQAVTHELVPP